MIPEAFLCAALALPVTPSQYAYLVKFMAFHYPDEEVFVLAREGKIVKDKGDRQAIKTPYSFQADKRIWIMRKSLWQST